MTEKFVFDIGMHTAQDTDLYLALGYRVVAVEANPTLVAQARTQFAPQVESGQLMIVHGCIAEKNAAAVDFYVNQVDSALSGLDAAAASRMGHRVVLVQVPVITMASLLHDHGVPFYLKIDIEGADRYCIEDLEMEKLPEWVSVEYTDPWFVERLRVLGYKRFKLVEQRGLQVLTRSVPLYERLFTTMCVELHDQRFAVRLKRRLARWLIPWARAADSLRRTKPSSAGAPGWKFEEGSSGPFGDDLNGEWVSADEVLEIASDYGRHYGKRKSELWMDLHAGL